MRLGIMQPYFFPYIGYISLIKHTDLFILLDDVQFIRHGWIERNRILKPGGGGWNYIAVPLKRHHRETPIREIRINNEIEWKQKIKAQLVCYKRAPYYRQVTGMLEEVFAEEYQDITSLDQMALRKTCEYLHIDTPIEVCSRMNLDFELAKYADEWALNICKAIDGVDEYWNPIGGMTFFDRSKYSGAGIDLKFMDMKLKEYGQFQGRFEKGLSILDVMMFEPAEHINEMLEGYRLL
mgnify:FL=1